MPTTGNTTAERKNLIDYNILNQDGDIKQSFANAASGTTILCEVAWADAEYFRWDMLGYSMMAEGALVRVLPERCEFDGCDEQYCMQCDLVRVITHTNTNDPTAWPVFERAVYQCQFAAPPYDVLEDSYVENGDESVRNVVWSGRSVASNEKIPGGGFRFVDAVAANRTPIGEVGVKTGRLTMLVAKWIDVPELPLISTIANKINEFPVTWNHRLYDAETVLLESWSYDYRKNPFGDWTYDITYNFAIRSDGRTWNKFWKNGASGYVEVSDDGTSGGDKPFALADFDDLFDVSLF